MNKWVKNFLVAVGIIAAFELLFFIHAWIASYPMKEVDGWAVLTIWATVLTVVFLVFSVMGMMNIDSRIKDLNEIREKLRQTENEAAETLSKVEESAEKERKKIISKAEEEIIKIINESGKRQNHFDQLTLIANNPDISAQIRQYTHILKTRTEKDGVNLSYVHMQRGGAYELLKRYDEAQSDYEQAIRLSPQVADVYNVMGVFLAKSKKDYEKSIEYCKKALELQNDLPETYVNIANSYEKLGNHKEAAKYYKLAQDYGVESFEWYYNQALSLHHNGEDKNGVTAEGYFKRALTLNPHFFQAAICLAMIYRERGDEHTATSVLSSVLNPLMHPDFTRAIIQRGETYFQQKQYGSALINFNFAYLYCQDDPMLLSRLASLNLLNGFPYQAIEFATKAKTISKEKSDNQYIDIIEAVLVEANKAIQLNNL